MAGNIKGITIEFQGDTTKLDKALRKIKNSTRDIDKELKQVDKALKFNPKNVDLWRQKQDLLTEKIKQTEKNLDSLKDMQAQMDAKGVDKQSEAYRTVQREIIETESKLRSYNNELRKIGNVNLRAMSAQFKDMGDKLTSAGQSMRGLSTAAAAVTAAIGALTVKSGKWADDINTMSKRYRIGTKDLQMYSAAAELVDVDVDTIAATHRKLTKSMASAGKGTGKQAEAFKALDVSITDSNGQLRDSDAVWNDVIKNLSMVENETEREALAMDLLGKSAGDLNPLLEDGGETYKNLADTMAKYNLDFIDQDTLDQANDFNDALDTIKAVGMVAFQQLGTQLAAYLAPAMEKVVDLVGRLAEWFSNLSPRTQAIIAGVSAFVAVLAPLLIGLGKVSFAISSIMSLMATVGPAIGGILTALGPIALVIAGVVAAGVLLYKNWDTIKAKASALKASIIATFNQIKAKVTAIWNSIKTAITKPINSAVNLVKSGIAKLKSIINGAKFKLPHIKLPHFKISGKLSLNPPSIPKVSVSWYKQGGIFDSPTIAGIGEAGPEAVVPLDKFWDKLDNLQGETSIVINIYGDNADPKQIANEVRRMLIKEVSNRRLAWQ